MRFAQHVSFLFFLALSTMLMRSEAPASCGAVSCFVVIGAQQQIPQQGLLTVSGIYNYTPMRLLSGATGIIPAADQAQQRLILDHHQEVRTITQTYTLDLNYGVTDRLALQLTVPYLKRKHLHIDGLGESATEAGEPVNFSDNGFGDVRMTAKYNVLPALRHTVVMGFGVELPTGDTQARDSSGQILESSGQLGRGQVGLIGSIYQTYELIPHRLSQFAFGSYRHTFRNRDGYQFGDEYQFNVGVNLVTTPWLVFTNQLNFRHLTQDNVTANLEQSATPLSGGEPTVIDPRILDRRVPNTGSTYFAYTPGFQLDIGQLFTSRYTEGTSVYVMAQIPVARDANNNLAQGTSFVFGITRSIQLVKPRS
ncbi:MAG TPA: hypothetical protein DEA71_16895 [Nitrospira sp.]|nr:hypothetical protein [Nitrospira sp.]